MTDESRKHERALRLNHGRVPKRIEVGIENAISVLGETVSAIRRLPTLAADATATAR